MPVQPSSAPSARERSPTARLRSTSLPRGARDNSPAGRPLQSLEHDGPADRCGPLRVKLRNSNEKPRSRIVHPPVASRSTRALQRIARMEADIRAGRPLRDGAVVLGALNSWRAGRSLDEALGLDVRARRWTTGATRNSHDPAGGGSDPYVVLGRLAVGWLALNYA